MKKLLTKNDFKIWHVVDGARVKGAPACLMGDVSRLSGDVTGITGNVSGIEGDVTGIEGYVSGIEGNVTGITGYLDLCEISDDDRLHGVKISDLIAN